MSNAFYINLQSSPSRRALLESNFRLFMPSWKLHRVEAIERRDVTAGQGKISEAESACYLSHVRALEHAQASGGHSLILEDDAFFGAQSSQLVSRSLELLNNQRWDILFLDVCIPQPVVMMQLFMMRKALRESDQISLLNLAQYGFSAATSYIVHADSRHKLLNLLGNQNTIKLPYDLQLREWVHQGALTAQAIFPYASTLSQAADTSNIQQSEFGITEATWNAFRRFMWIGAEDSAVDPVAAIRALPEGFCDQNTESFLQILRASLSDRFRHK
jgi:GR25 family glycosyltransferase involved in LPS biosynthesis